jgi:chaperone required for assembly of F1-ATPase
MKKFFKNAEAGAVEGGFTVLLDGRAIRTPAKTAFVVPTEALAAAIAEEWAGQGEELDPATMPLTGLCYAAIDRVRLHRGHIEGETAGYAATDLLCHRATTPAELVQRQTDQWQPLLDWAADKLSMRLNVVEGILGEDQPPEALVRAAELVGACDDFTLAGLDRLTHITGSLVLGLAVVHNRLDGKDAYDIGHMEERYQAEMWGTDTEAEERHEHRLVEMLAAERLVRLLG